MGDEFGLVGTCLEGRYDVEREVSRGGFGTVYFAKHRALLGPVAVKVLRPEGELTREEQREFEQRFLEEARTVAGLKHPAVVRALDFGVTSLPNGQVAPWMALEWVEGRSLKAILEEGGGAPLAPGETLALLRPVLEALAEAHAQGLAHRDVKPANVLVCEAGGPVPSRLVDFGIAKVLRPEERAVPTGETATGSASGACSPAYAAPEQVSGARTGPWTDVHALGLVLTEVLTGRRVYPGEDPVELASAALSPSRPTPGFFGVDVGPWEPVLARALSLRASERYEDAGELLAALEEALPREARPASEGGSVGRARRRSRAPWVAAGVAIGALGVGSFLAWHEPTGAVSRAPSVRAEDAGSPGGSVERSVRCGALAGLPDVRGLTGVVELASGGGHTCARLGDGSVRCWGENADGEVGDGSRDDRWEPVRVAGLGGVTGLAAGGLVSCALGSRGAVWCWGRGIVPGSEEPQSVRPGVVRGVVGATALAAGTLHACAVGAGGAVLCWGQNDRGQLGVATGSEGEGAVRVELPGRAVRLAAGEGHTCAALEDGAVWCWGRRDHGELGDGRVERGTEGRPARAGELEGVTGLVAGGGFTCGATREGAVWCWGQNDQGQLGDGTDVTRARPVAVRGLTGVTSLVAGAAHACARTGAGAVWCWGANGSCEQGAGGLERRLAPTESEGLAGLGSLSAGQAHGCGVTASGGVRCWGWNRYGQLGRGVASEALDTE